MASTADAEGSGRVGCDGLDFCEFLPSDRPTECQLRSKNLETGVFRVTNCGLCSPCSYYSTLPVLSYCEPRVVGYRVTLERDDGDSRVQPQLVSPRYKDAR